MTDYKKAFIRLEQLRKKGTITDENAELVSYREGKYSNEKQNDKGRFFMSERISPDGEGVMFSSMDVMVLSRKRTTFLEKMFFFFEGPHDILQGYRR